MRKKNPLAPSQMVTPAAAPASTPAPHGPAPVPNTQSAPNNSQQPLLNISPIVDLEEVGGIDSDEKIVIACDFEIQNKKIVAQNCHIVEAELDGD